MFLCSACDIIAITDYEKQPVNYSYAYYPDGSYSYNQYYYNPDGSYSTYSVNYPPYYSYYYY